MNPRLRLPIGQPLIATIFVLLCLGFSPVQIERGFQRMTLAAHPTSSLQIASSSATVTPSQVTNVDEEVVYLDTNGFIRVLDTNPPANKDPVVQWVSPVDGWRDFALGDFNNDNDLEIVAVGGGSQSGRLTIYDPVMVTGTVDADQIINEIPWDILYDAALPGRPLLVQTGDLMPDIPGDEIAFVFELNPADRTDPSQKTRLVLWQADLDDDTIAPDGRQWQQLANHINFANTWQRLALGDLDNSLSAENSTTPRFGEEIVLVDGDVGVVEIYRIEPLTAEEDAAPVVRRLYENKSGNRPWLDGIVARFVPGPIKQVALSRASRSSGKSLWVLYYNPASSERFEDSYAELFLPPGRVLFAGDINADGDDELFLLRSLPANATVAPHLIMRNYNNDIADVPLPTFELRLDADNGYTAGTAGDVDGDGLDEVIIMRDNNIRVYTAPASIATEASNFTPAATTDQRTIHVGNLDQNGTIELPQLAVSPTTLSVSLSAGQESPLYPLGISNINQDAPDPIMFTVRAEGDPVWLRLSPSSGTTSGFVNVQFDTTAVPPGTYRTRVIVTSPDLTVRNIPFPIDVTLTIRPGLVPAQSMLIVPYNCNGDNTPVTTTLALNGVQGLTFSAKITAGTAMVAGSPTTATAVSAPAVIWPSDLVWVTASSPNVLPTTMTLTFDPAMLPTENGQAQLVMTFYDEFGPQTRIVPITFSCNLHWLYMPLIRAQ